MKIKTIKSGLEKMIRDKEVINDIISKIESNSEMTITEIAGIKVFKKDTLVSKSFDDFLFNNISIKQLPDALLLEAIVQVYGRPALLIQNDNIEEPLCPILASRLNLNSLSLKRAIKSVGRIELDNHDSIDWVGTGWLVTDRIIVTNRHVAEVFSFASPVSNKIFFKTNLDSMARIKPSIDFKKELGSTQSMEFKIKKVLYMAKSDMPDLALLEIIPNNIQNQVPPNPIELDTEINNKLNNDIAIIGYPAFDSRNLSIHDMNRIFSKIYNVKRLQPGKLIEIQDETCFCHDCSTLGGNSGSPVIDIQSGKALGVHFSGKYLKKNYAIPSIQIDRILKQL